MKNEYFVNGTTPEKVVEEGLKVFEQCMDYSNEDRGLNLSLYLYPDGSMGTMESAGREWPDPKYRALCIVSYGPEDGNYMDAAFEEIEDSIMEDISEKEQQEILDYIEDNGVGIEAYKVCQPELFEQYDNDARAEALDFEREKLEKTVADLATTLNYTPNKKSLSDVKKTVAEKKAENENDGPVKNKTNGR